MFDRLRDDVTEPDRFTRGRLAVKLAGSYLALVVVSFVVLVVAIATVGSVNSDTAAFPLVLLTAPLSFTCAAAIGNIFYPPPLVGAFELLVYGVVIAWWLWRVIRGGRYVAPDRADH
ncbi:MAG: hypothetical protein ABI131_02445 [Nostocoides sp.]